MKDKNATDYVELNDTTEAFTTTTRSEYYFPEEDQCNERIKIEDRCLWKIRLREM